MVYYKGYMENINQNAVDNPHKKSTLMKWAIIVAIMIVLNMLFNYTISLFYKLPAWDEYFKQPQVITQIDNKDECLKVGGQWNENNYNAPTSEIQTAPIKGNQITGYCDPNYTKNLEYQKLQKNYDRNIFIILVILGIISILTGVFVKNEIINIALPWGGVLSLVIASMRYWSSADNIVKVIILFVALGALIWLAIKKFNK